MVFEILSTTVFGREKKGEVGVDRLVEEGGFSACFPLHDVRIIISIFYNVLSHWYLRDHSSTLVLMSPILSWTKGRFFTSSGHAGETGISINHWTTSETILGRKLQFTLPGLVRIVFAYSSLPDTFAGFYTGWLLPASLVGLGVFIYGVVTLDQNSIANEVCSEAALK